LKVTNMKKAAIKFFVLVITISTLSKASEIPVTSRDNIIKSVLYRYHSTCVNILNCTKYQGASVKCFSVGVTEQCQLTYPQRVPHLVLSLFNNAATTAEAI
jgi:hypothetical protein